MSDTLRNFIDFAKHCSICNAPMHLDVDFISYPKLFVTHSKLFVTRYISTEDNSEYLTFFTLNKKNEYQFAISMGLDKNTILFHNKESEQKFANALLADDSFSYLTSNCSNKKCQYSFHSTLIFFDLEAKTFDTIKLFSESFTFHYKQQTYAIESYYRSQLTEIYSWQGEEAQSKSHVVSFIPLKIFNNLSKKNMYKKISNIILLT